MNVVCHMNQTQEISRLLRLAKIAQAKVEFNHNGTKVINPMQQAAATRIMNKVYKLSVDMSTQEFIDIQKEVSNNLKKENNYDNK
jgi:hypothetical protein